jgi:hypothetical protein
MRYDSADLTMTKTWTGLPSYGVGGGVSGGGVGGGVGGAGVGGGVGGGVGNGTLLTLPQVTFALDFLPPLLLGLSQHVSTPSKVQNRHFFSVAVDHVEHFEQQSAGLVAGVCS